MNSEDREDVARRGWGVGLSILQIRDREVGRHVQGAGGGNH